MLVKARLYERNVRYENADKSLSGQDIVLRLRQDDRVRLTYKAPLAERRVDSITEKFEAEVTVSDFDTMDVILGRLGYTPYLIYEKYRTTYRYDELEIVLDELPYGNFIEIEGDSERIGEMRARLGLGDAPAFTDSYVDLLAHVRRALGIISTDLTFENFSGVIVPLSAFYPPKEGKDDGRTAS